MIKFRVAEETFEMEYKKLCSLFDLLHRMNNQPFSLLVRSNYKDFWPNYYILSPSMNLIIGDGDLILEDLNNWFVFSVPLKDIEEIYEDGSSTFIRSKTCLIEFGIDPCIK